MDFSRSSLGTSDLNLYIIRPVRIDINLDILNNRPIFYGKCAHGVGEYAKKIPIFSHVGKPPFLDPIGAMKVSKGGPLQNRNFDVVKL